MSLTINALIQNEMLKDLKAAENTVDPQDPLDALTGGVISENELGQIAGEYSETAMRSGVDPETMAYLMGAIEARTSETLTPAARKLIHFLQTAEAWTQDQVTFKDVFREAESVAATSSRPAHEVMAHCLDRLVELPFDQRPPKMAQIRDAASIIAAGGTPESANSEGVVKGILEGVLDALSDCTPVPALRGVGNQASPQQPVVSAHLLRAKLRSETTVPPSTFPSSIRSDCGKLCGLTLVCLRLGGFSQVYQQRQLDEMSDLIRPIMGSERLDPTRTLKAIQKFCAQFSRMLPEH